jgi:DNA adenine methylase
MASLVLPILVSYGKYMRSVIDRAAESAIKFDAKRMMSKPVNVASAPQRSPFRYPGGKTWFVPTFKQWIASLSPQPRLLIEPFAGGGIISLTALFENLVDCVVMVELDEDVAAVWQSVVNGDAQWLADRITSFNLTKETVLEELSKELFRLT